MALFTDGLVECVNAKEEIFGQEQLQMLLAEFRQLEAAGVKNVVLQKAAEFYQNKYLNDLTLMVVAIA